MIFYNDFKKGNGFVIVFKLDSDNPILYTYIYNNLIIFITLGNTITCNLFSTLLKIVFTKR